MDTKTSYTRGQMSVLVILRLLIGWHFLYEGVVKLWSSSWSAGGFLMDSGGPLAGLFHALAANSSVLAVVDFLNIWGLILIGLGLILGGLTRYAAMAGMIMLGLFYLSHPPLIGSSYALPSEGSYLLVNKNLIELFALAVIYLYPTSHLFGLDRILFRRKATTEAVESSPAPKKTEVPA